MRIDRTTIGEIVTTKNRYVGNTYELFMDGICIRSFTTIKTTAVEVGNLIWAMINNCGLNIASIPVNGPTHRFHFAKDIGGSLKDDSILNDHDYIIRHSEFVPVPNTTLYVQSQLYYLPFLFKKILVNSNLQYSTHDIWLEIDGDFELIVPKQIHGYNDDPLRSNIYYDEDVNDDEIIPGLIGFLKDEREKIFNSRTLSDISGLLNGFKSNELFDVPVLLSKKTPYSAYPVDIEEEERTEVDDAIRKKRDNNDYNNRRRVIKNNGRYYLIGRILGEYVASKHMIILYYRNLCCPDEEEYKACISNILAHELFHFLHNLFIGKKFFSNAKHRTRVLEATADSFCVQYTLENSRGSSRYSTACYRYADERFYDWINGYKYWPYSFALHFYCRQYEIDLFYWNVLKFCDVVRESKNDIEDAYMVLIR